VGGGGGGGGAWQWVNQIDRYLGLQHVGDVDADTAAQAFSGHVAAKPKTRTGALINGTAASRAAMYSALFFFLYGASKRDSHQDGNSSQSVSQGGGGDPSIYCVWLLSNCIPIQQQLSRIFV